MRDMIEGKNPVKDVLTFFDQQWRHRYAEGSQDRYEFTNLDAARVKLRLKTHDVRTMQTRIANYFNDRADWLVAQRHPFNVFLTRHNRYKVDRGLHPPNLNSPAYAFVGETPEPPHDCTHDPPCSTEHECAQMFRVDPDS